MQWARRAFWAWRLFWQNLQLQTFQQWVHRMRGAVCAVCGVQCAVCVLCGVRCAQCAVWCAQCTVCGVRCAQCAVCVLCACWGPLVTRLGSAARGRLGRPSGTLARPADGVRPTVPPGRCTIQSTIQGVARDPTGRDAAKQPERAADPTKARRDAASGPARGDVAERTGRDRREDWEDRRPRHRAATWTFLGTICDHISRI